MEATSIDDDPQKDERFNVVLAGYLKRKDAGESVNQNELLKAHPEFKQELQSWFEAEVMLEEGVVPSAEPIGRVAIDSSEIRDTLKPGSLESDTASEFNVRSFGRYQLLRPLGEGAMGSVYLARDTILDRQVALKMPKTEGCDNAEFMLRFAREAKAAAALRHENICSVYDAGEHDGVAFITMDYIDGVPLSRFVASPQLSCLDNILKMTSTIAAAVHHAHINGVVHRDLKPGNILVDEELRPFVTDFGLARRDGADDESRITQEGLLLGTPAYMAPEQIKGEQAKVGPRSDIYSLGVILFELLTARLPFEGRIPELLAKSLRDEPPIPSRIREGLTEDVDDLCLKMLKKDPGKRFASMAEVADELTRLRQKIAAHAGRSSNKQEKKGSPFANRKAHIEAMLKNGQYAEALRDLEKLAKDTRPAAKAVADWAKKKLPAVRKESRALSPAGLQALMKTASQMYNQHDYPGCIQLVEEIPPLRRTEAMEDLLIRAKETELKAERLLVEIKSRERQQEVSGLESLVKGFLKLKPGNKYARRLWQALQTYGTVRPSARRYHFEKGRLQQMPEPSMLQRWLLLGSLVGTLVFLVVYSYTIIYLKSGSQTLAVHVDGDWLQSQGGELTLLVDGNQHTIFTASSDGATMTVDVTFGKHTFSVTHGDVVVHDPQTFEISKGGRRILSITPANLQLLNSLPVPEFANANDTAAPEPAVAISDSDLTEIFSEPFDAPKLAVAPFPADEAERFQRGWADRLGQPVAYSNSIGMTLKLVPAGKFMMGSPPFEEHREEDEGPRHAVTISRAFYLQTTEVTQSQWTTLMGTEPWKGETFCREGSEFPASQVSFDDAEVFCLRLSSQHGKRYRLPTEAEWEYACRAGSISPWCFGTTTDQLDNYVWWGGQFGNGNCRDEKYAHRVGHKLGNPFGLKDMHGNLHEWCSDWYDENYYENAPAADPAGPASGEFRVLRGGSWNHRHSFSRSANRGYSSTAPRFDVGFRVVMEIDAAESERLATSINGNEISNGQAGPPNKDQSRASIPMEESSNERLNAQFRTISQVHGATEEQLNRWVQNLPKGYRPYWISLRSAGPEIRFDALARTAPTQSEWKLDIFDASDGAHYEAMAEKFRPAIVNIYEEDNIVKKQILWGDDDPGWNYWIGDETFIGEKINEGFRNVNADAPQPEHFIPTNLSALNYQGGVGYELCQAYGPYTEGEFLTNLTMPEINLMRYHKKGWRLHLLAGIRNAPDSRYCVVFVKNGGLFRKWAVSRQLTVGQYRELLLKVDSRGGWPRCVVSTIEEGQVVYSVLWDEITQQELLSIPIVSSPDSPTGLLKDF